MATRVAYHAFRRPCRAAEDMHLSALAGMPSVPRQRAGRLLPGVNDINPFVGTHGHASRLDVPRPATAHHLEPISLSARSIQAVPSQLIALPDDDAPWLVAREPDGFVDEGLIAHRWLVPLDAA